METNNAVNNNNVPSDGKAQMSHKSHKAPSCMTHHSSKASFASLHKTSTFVSKSDVFKRRAEAHREEISDVDDRAAKGGGASISNEVVEQVFNLVDE